MITDPNYVQPYIDTDKLDTDSYLMVIRELSGSHGEQPLTVVEQVSMTIESVCNTCDSNYIY